MDRTESATFVVMVIAVDLLRVCEPECAVCEHERYESQVPSIQRAARVLLPPEEDIDEERQS